MPIMIWPWLVLCLANAGSTLVIETFPALPENKLARGYSGLRLSIERAYLTSQYSCQWRFGAMSPIVIRDGSSYTYYCRNVTGTGYALTCAERNSRIYTSLTITGPIQQSSVARLQCRTRSYYSYYDLGSLSLTVADCASSVPGFVLNFASATYNSSGTLSCGSNGTLFNSNGTELNLMQVTCLATAEWSGVEGLECWKAPNVTIHGELTVIEGDDLTLSCDYVDVVPIGNKSTFHFGDIVINLKKDCDLTMPNLTRADNNKSVSCQALTPFSKLHPENGRSDSRTVKVLYEPYQDNPSTCTWMANTTQICKVSFHANSDIKVEQITKNGTLTNGILSPVYPDGEHVVSFHFGLYQDVTMDDAGRYEAQVTSVVPPNNHTIYFDVIVVETDCNTVLPKESLQ